MKIIKKLTNIKIFADGASIDQIINFNKINYISGFTTNPSLMRRSGVKNYKLFAKNILSKIKKKPISFEVFSDDFNSMYKEALIINSWGKNVYVKIPIQNTKGKLTTKLIKRLVDQNVKCNITAVFTLSHIKEVLKVINKDTSIIISVFCGRIADTGVDPVPLIKKILSIVKKYKRVQILWASTRELFNIFQAKKIGCHIITVPFDILNKFNLVDLDLNYLSLDTVKSFYKDAKASKFKI